MLPPHGQPQDEKVFLGTQYYKAGGKSGGSVAEL